MIAGYSATLEYGGTLLRMKNPFDKLIDAAESQAKQMQEAWQTAGLPPSEATRNLFDAVTEAKQYRSSQQTARLRDALSPATVFWQCGDNLYRHRDAATHRQEDVIRSHFGVKRTDPPDIREAALKVLLHFYPQYAITKKEVHC